MEEEKARNKFTLAELDEIAANLGTKIYNETIQYLSSNEHLMISKKYSSQLESLGLKSEDIIIDKGPSKGFLLSELFERVSRQAMFDDRFG